MTGFAGDTCVLFTAHDAYMRDNELIVPADYFASEAAAVNSNALGHLKRFLRVASPR